LSQTQIKAVLFDLGETLLNFGQLTTGGLFEEAGRLSYTFLKEANQPVGRYRLYLWRHLLWLRWRYLLSNITGKDFDSLAALKEYGAKKRFNLSEEQWEQLNWLWYEPLSRKVSIEPDLAETLERLRRAGLKLGLLSNTFVNGSSLEKHLAMEGLLEFFSVRLYSYQFGFRKPDKRIFLEAARQVGAEPANILFVGDKIDKDIRGALRAGMQPILKAAYTNAGKRCPDAVVRIERISELPGIVEKINNVSR